MHFNFLLGYSCFKETRSQVQRSFVFSHIRTNTSPSEFMDPAITVLSSVARRAICLCSASLTSSEKLYPSFSLEFPRVGQKSGRLQYNFSAAPEICAHAPLSCCMRSLSRLLSSSWSDKNLVFSYDLILLFVSR